MIIAKDDRFLSVKAEFSAMMACIDITEARANAALALANLAKKEAELAFHEARMIHKVSVAMVEAARTVLASPVPIP